MSKLLNALFHHGSLPSAASRHHVSKDMLLTTSSRVAHLVQELKLIISRENIPNLSNTVSKALEWLSLAQDDRDRDDRGQYGIFCQLEELYMVVWGEVRQTSPSDPSSEEDPIKAKTFQLLSCVVSMLLYEMGFVLGALRTMDVSYIVCGPFFLSPDLQPLRKSLSMFERGLITMMGSRGILNSDDVCDNLSGTNVGDSQRVRIVGNSSLAQPVEVYRSSALTMSEFEGLIHPSTDVEVRPFVIPDIARGWRAVDKWCKPAFWLEGPYAWRSVPIECGAKYTDDDWSLRIVFLREFVKECLLDGKGTQEPSPTKDCLASLQDHPLYTGPCPALRRGRKAYLAQHSIFSQIPDLQSDVQIPDYCCVEAFCHDPYYLDDDPERMIWFGPTGTISPLHTDPYHNILVQVVGEKRVILYPPQDSDKLYPRTITTTANTNTISNGASGINNGGDTHGKNTAGVDPMNWDETAHPDFARAQGMQVILKPGEGLYIPPGWWHYVESLSASISVSFWR